MDAKTYLTGILKLENRIADLAARLEDLEAGNLQSINYSLPKVQSQHLESRTEREVITLTALRKEYAEAVANYRKEYAERLELINKLDKTTYKQVLILRYLSGEGKKLPLKIVAKKMNKSYQRTMKLHGEALRTLDHMHKT